MLPFVSHLALWFSSSSDDGKTVLYAFIGVFVGIGLFIRGFRVLQRKRLILDTPTSHVRSAAIGLVELNGLAVGPHTIVSPITQRPCFYYRTAVWKEVGSGKNRHWEQKIDERFHVPFFLQDETGMVLIDPNGAEMDIHCDFKAEYNRSMFTTMGVPPRVVEFAGRNGVTLDDNVRVEEYCLKPRNAMYILGTLATNAGLAPTALPVPTTSSLTLGKFDLGGGRAGLVRSVLSLANLNVQVNVTRTSPATLSPAQPVKLTEIDRKMAERRAKEAAADESRQGASPAAAHPADRAQAALAAIAAQNPALAATAATFLGTNLPTAFTGAAPQPAKDPVEQGVAPAQDAYPEKCPTVICKGRNNPAFYISWRSQKDIVSDLSKRSALYIVGGPALTIACVVYLLGYFKAL